ncbi:MAG: DUF2889 domain-containing protein [Rhodospirillales bacterium]
MSEAQTMPLSAPAPRAPVHHRRVECRGYRRPDGLWDIEGHLIDTRDADFVLRFDDRTVRAGEPIHAMSVRLTIDPDMTVRAIEACADAVPTEICPGAVAQMQCLVGLRIAPGWTNAVKQRLGGPRGCTHLMELMWPVATTAYQTLAGHNAERTFAPAQPGRKPAKLDSCWAYAADREVVRRFWPEHHVAARID